MQTANSGLLSVRRFAGLLLLAAAASASAQTSLTIPVVTIRTTDTNANWAGDPGVFTVFRDGPTNLDLSVFYNIGGTAGNGVDYALIGNTVSIPAGIRSNTIVIKPVVSNQTVTKSVELHLAFPPTMQPINYNIGLVSNAALFIRPAPVPTNLPPFVAIASPPGGSVFPPGATIPVCANASDRDGYVCTVQFFAGSTSLGITTNSNPVSASAPNPFCLTWSNVPPGDYALRALATDNLGAVAYSEPVRISVSTNTVVTNYPPVVRVTSPANNTVFRTPVDVPLFAYARDVDDPIAAVEFLCGSNSLGFGTPMPVSPVTMSNSLTTLYPSNLFTLVWSNAPLGTYGLRARAWDTNGAMGISEPITISILAPVPPPTNPPPTPVVSIVSVDPIAIEGTNCWQRLAPTNPTPTWSNWISSTTPYRYYTNCGPKNALFAVRRDGSTSNLLSVAYEVGGTATNGVNYVALPGTVTIPANERTAFIPVVPLDDGVPGPNLTVILGLKKAPISSNVPPAYLVGYPAKAGALIVDSTNPQPATGVLPDKTFHVKADGPDGAWFHVEYTTDMANWTPICTNQVVNGAINFVDPEASANQVRFYRAVPESGPPAL